MTEYRDRLRRLSPGGTLGTLEWGPDGIISASEGAAALCGRSREQMVGLQFNQLLAPNRYLEMFDSQLVDGFRGLYELERPGESLVRVEWTYHSQAAGSGRFDMIFWEIADAPSSLPRLHLRGAA